MHRKLQHLGDSSVHLGQQVADQARKEAAESEILLVLPEKRQKLGPKSPQDPPENNQLANILKATQITDDG